MFSWTGIGVFDPTQPDCINLEEAFSLAGPNPSTNTVSFAQFISICDPEQIKQAQSRLFNRLSSLTDLHGNDGDDSSDNEEMPLLHEHQALKRKIAALLSAADDVDGTRSGGVAKEDAISDEELVTVYSVQGPNGLLKLATELNLIPRIHGEDGQDDRAAEDILMSLDVNGHGQITLMQLLSTISHIGDINPNAVNSDNGSMHLLSPSPRADRRGRRHSVLAMAIQGHLTTDDMMALVHEQQEHEASMDANIEASMAAEPEVRMRPKKDYGDSDNLKPSPLQRRSSVTDIDGMAVAQLQRQGSLKEASQLRKDQESRTVLSQQQFNRHSLELKQRQIDLMHEATAKQTAEENAARIAKNRREARSRWLEVVLPMPWDA